MPTRYRPNSRRGLRAPAPTVSITARCLLAIALCSQAGLTAAQSHEQTKDGYTLRSSTVSSMSLNEQTAREHGIDRDPDKGVLNVVVLRQPSGVPVSAQVTATARSLTGRPESIHLKEVGANRGVSYVGTYSFVPREVLDFTITARPRTENSLEISLSYRDRMWR